MGQNHYVQIFMASYQNQGLQKQCRLESTIIIPKEKEAILPVLDCLAEDPLDAFRQEHPLPIQVLPLLLPPSSTTALPHCSWEP